MNPGLSFTKYLDLTSGKSEVHILTGAKDSFFRKVSIISHSKAKSDVAHHWSWVIKTNVDFFLIEWVFSINVK